MSVHVPLGDRRVCLRFEAAGQLWASLDFESDVEVRNLAPGGMLIEAQLDTPFKPLRAARIVLPDGGRVVDAIVRHVTPVDDVSGESRRYLIGFEFVNITPPLRVALERVVRRWATPRAD